MDRIPSDHDSIDTVSATLGRHAGRRHRVEIAPDDRDRFPVDEIVRVTIDGTRRHARVESHLTDDRVLITGAYDGPELVRDPSDATDRLAEWIADAGLDEDDPVLVDVVAEGFLYGLRTPGERVFYDDPDPPDEGLASIARDLTDGE